MGEAQWEVNIFSSWATTIPEMSTQVHELPRRVDRPTPREVNVYRRVELNKAQKEWLRDRDERTCQYPEAHICFGILHLHHILPYRWAQEIEELAPEQINMPENLILLCENIHVGHDKAPPDERTLHPDTRQAKWEYYHDHDKQAFHKMAERRNSLVASGIRYWYAGRDDKLRMIAIERTRRKERYKERFPDRMMN